MKYGNQPCEIDGFKLDSQLELNCYNEIKAAIQDKPYVIKRSNNGIQLLPDTENFKGIIWRPDFTLWHIDKMTTSAIVEIKGCETPEFLLKMNIASRLSFWPITIFCYKSAIAAEGSKMAKHGGLTTYPALLADTLFKVLKREG